jgi:hypothetical protein
MKVFNLTARVVFIVIRMRQMNTRIGQVDGRGDGRAAAGDLLGRRPGMARL